ncbi:MAG: tetratricopeptide repeat protein [Deltaproteobacteria bacterium]|nr:tetratricopeptide repeat protein [Deltaproteobacteria bacterium]
MALTCRQCGAAFDPAVEGEDTDVKPATCPQCGVSMHRRSTRQEAAAETASQLPTVLSMSEKRTGGNDYMANGVLVVTLLVMVLSGVYLFRHVKNISIDKPLDTLTEGAENLLLLARHKVEDLIQTVDPRKPRSPGAKRLVRMGYDHYVKNRFQQALESLNQAVEKDPKNPEAYYWRGRTLIKLRRYNLAVDNFQKAVTLRADYWQAHDNLGWLCMQKEDYAACLVHLDRSIASKPDNGWALYNRSRVHDRLGNREKAMADAKKGCAMKNKKACELLERYRNAS